MSERPRTILVATDFSAAATAAFAPARDLARAFEAAVVLVHVAPPDLVPGELEPGGMLPGDLRRNLQRAGMDQLHDLERRHFEGLRVQVALREGHVLDELAATALERRAGLILIATHGRSGFGHALLGSTAERLVRTSPVPVLTVRTDRPEAAPSLAEVRRVLLPIDFSDDARLALSCARWFDGPSTELLFAHVVPAIGYPDSPLAAVSVDWDALAEDHRRAAVQRMGAWMDQVRPDHPNAQHVLLRGQPAEELARLADERQVDLIVMPTHGRTGFRRWYMGSVAEKVVRTARCPVLTTRAPTA